MLNGKILPALLITTCSLFEAGLASEAVSLEQFLRWSELRSPSLQRTSLERELDRPSKLAAWGQFLPSISVGYEIEQSWFYNPTYLNPDGTVATYPRVDTIRVNNADTVVVQPVPEGKRRNSGLYLRFEELLFDGGRNYLNLKNSSLTRQLISSYLREERFALRSEVTRAYSQTVAAERRLDLSGKVVDQRRLQLDLARTRFTTGSVTRRDVMQAEVDLGRALSDSLAAASDVRRVYEELNLLTGLPLDTSYILSGLPRPFEPSWDVDSLAREALICRGDLSTVELTTRIRRNEFLAARGDYLPQLSASYILTRSEQSGVNIPFTLDPRNRYSQVGLTASWQLFDRFTRSLQLQKAKVRRHQADLEFYELTQAVHHQVHTAIDRLAALYQQAQVAEQNSRWAEETLLFEQERYRLGSATVIELGAAQLSYIQARHDQIYVETEFHIALGELEMATGLELR